MATFQKRGRAWRAIVRKGGQTHTGTFDSKAKAQDWAAQIEAAIVEGRSPATGGPAAPAPSPQAVRTAASAPTMADLFDRYGREVSPTKAGCRWELLRLERFKSCPELMKPITELSNEDIIDFRDRRLKEVSPATVNRELNLLSAVITQAIKDWKIRLPANPVHLIRRPPQPPHRTRRVSEAELRRITEHLGWDGVSPPRNAEQWTAWAFALAIASAMRQGEIAGLRWRDLALERRKLHLSKTKNGHSRDVPLSSRAVSLLRLLPPGRPEERIVPINANTISVTFTAAKKALGLHDLHFHDSRREAVTTASKRLANVLELKAFSGHRTTRMLEVYYQPNVEELAEKLG